MGLEMILGTRVLASLFLGFLLGVEREVTGKFAGLRTHILVCLGSTVFTLLSIYGFKYILADGTIAANDPARIAAQIITGIGFIGAGTVMRHGTTVSGITTAATLWVAAAVGMACGCGMYYLGTVVTLVTLITLIAIRYFEKKFLIKRTVGFKNFDITFLCPTKDYDKISTVVEENFPSINRIKKKMNKDETFSIKLNVTTRKPLAKINEIFKNTECIELLEIREDI